MQAALEAIWQDARFGMRILWRAPAITLLVILALALGIGVNSAMFSVIDAMVLHPVNYERPEELTLIVERDSRGALHTASAGNYLDWRNAKSFAGMAAFAQASYVVTGLDKPVQIQGSRVTANIFNVLGVKPILGRTFLVGEDGLDGSSTVSKVAVISYGLWQNALAADPNVLGRSIRLNDVPYAIVGVMRPDFELINRRHQVWIPATLNAANRDNRYLGVLARLKAPMDQAAAEMSALSASLAANFPDSNQGWTAQFQDLLEFLINRETRTRLLLLFGAVGVVLLLACSNVASLLLARSSSRVREIALRISLGASRPRIMRQLLVESLMLSLLGGALGLLLSAGLIQLAPSLVPPSAIRTTSPIELNALVIEFTFGLSILTGILFGLAPAIASSTPDVQEVLQDTTRGATGGRARQLFRQAVVTIEVAVSLMLMAGAGFMIRGIDRLSQADLGLNIENVLTQRVQLPLSRFDSAGARRFYRQAIESASALPGVTKAAAGTVPPLSGPGMEVAFDLESSPVRPIAEMPLAAFANVSPDYFAMLKVPVVAGREFSETDTENSPQVAVINSALATRFFPNTNPVGQRIRLNTPVLGSNNLSGTVYMQIVGVVGNTTPGEIGTPPVPTIFAPMQQNLWSLVHWIGVRTSSDSGKIAPALRDALLSINSGIGLEASATLQDRFEQQFAEPRFQTRLMGGFSMVALVLALVGIYGLNAYAVSQRQREIGVRLALGASPSSVVAGIFQSGMKLTLIGIVIGLVGAVALSWILNSTFVGASPIEWIPLLGAALVLTAAAALANWLPAWRVSRIDPAIALRND